MRKVCVRGLGKEMAEGISKESKMACQKPRGRKERRGRELTIGEG